ncbi:glycine cleavage system protein GcvH [Proteiniclasticum sp. BAD-10]|uniref:Glycine cleavage system H protein n=1 Tax=Proteiniclasticum sediminis TaxID=2804028 RepID=A0A941CNU8_9CLOT|nr:glycine cleavage system protein GcvH [Proteiniclasticum sediminis]MBR0575334.1 glycine cleavage system protein GcvH [Proteiniclasticum sediminis]
MSIVLEGLFYTKEHEWVRVEGDKAYIGITDYAQHSLGSIVYVEMPSVGDELAQEDNLGVVESVKAASDIYMPVSGEVLEINEELEDNPALLNENAYDHHLVVVALKDKSELDDLLGKEDYEALIAGEE